MKPKRNQDFIGFHENSGVTPPYNVKSTLVPCTGTDTVFLYGGFDDSDALDSNVYLLNTKTMIWEIDDTHQGLYREGHSATYIGNGNILVFGGIPFDDIPIPDDNLSTESVKIDSLMIIYNIFEKKWIGPPKFALEGAPSSRSRHASCLSSDGTKLYISGGLVDSTPLDDLYCYDLISGVWQGPIQFAPRFDHFLSINGEKLFSFGGLDKDMNHTKEIICWYSLRNGTIGEVKVLKGSTKEDDPVSLLDGVVHGVESIHLNTEGDPAIKLTICLPVWNNNPNEFKISYVDLNEFEFRTIFNMQDLTAYVERSFETPLDLTQYSWKKAFVARSGLLFLLGSRKTAAFTVEGEPLSRDSHLSCMLHLKLDRFGIPMEHSPKDGDWEYSSDSTMTNSLKRLLIDQIYTDFEIICESNDSSKQSVFVHKAILAARWPHFERMLLSGMAETVSNSLQMPEPYNWVRALVHYLYTGNINFGEYLSFDLLDYSGLLMLSNMYELPILRSLTLTKVHETFENFQTTFLVTNTTNVSKLIKLWQDLTFSNEDIFIIKVITMLKQHWPVITHSEAFLRLSKDEIVKLCQDCSSEKDVTSKQISKSNSTSSDSIQHFSDVETPTRNTNSPFLIDSPPNRNLLANSTSVSSLQHLSGVLNNNL